MIHCLYFLVLLLKELGLSISIDYRCRVTRFLLSRNRYCLYLSSDNEAVHPNLIQAAVFPVTG